MATRRRGEAERAIVHEWDKWAEVMAEKFGPSADMCFFYFLERDRPDLLDFGYSGDKWRAVQMMLLSANRITY
jgi:hypothetical protein